MSKTLADLRADVTAARLVRDAIETCCSPEWAAAHAILTAACRLADAERDRLAANPATRYGAWRESSDKILMAWGYL